MTYFNLLRQSVSHLDLPGNAIRGRAEEVDFSHIDPKVLKEIIKGLFYELYKSDGGVGLAAPMLGLDLRIAVIDTRDETPLVLINPEILEESSEVDVGIEANLCLPEIAAKVSRPTSIDFRAYDQQGKFYEMEANGLLARIVLHELEVLDGKMFHDNVPENEIISTAPAVLASKATSLIYKEDDSSDDLNRSDISRMRYLSPATLSPPLLDLKDSVLRKKCTPISFDEWTYEQLRKLVEEMIWLQHYHEGVGIAAPQVGLTAQMTVIDNRKDPPYVLINPRITEMSEEKESAREGCLSLPFIYGSVERPLEVRVDAYNIHGEEFDFEAEGFLARIIQHEVDHLNGILFTDHIDSEDKLLIERPDLVTEKTIQGLFLP